jgi:hypothetical protein
LYEDQLFRVTVQSSSAPASEPSVEQRVYLLEQDEIASLAQPQISNGPSMNAPSQSRPKKAKQPRKLTVAKLQYEEESVDPAELMFTPSVPDAALVEVLANTVFIPKRTPHTSKTKSLLRRYRSQVQKNLQGVELELSAEHDSPSESESVDTSVAQQVKHNNVVADKTAPPVVVFTPAEAARRKKEKARQRKLLTIVILFVAILVLIFALLYFFLSPSKSGGKIGRKSPRSL